MTVLVLQEALTTMTTRNFRHLPIKDEAGVVVGMIDVAQLLHVRQQRNTVKIMA